LAEGLVEGRAISETERRKNVALAKKKEEEGVLRQPAERKKKEGEPGMRENNPGIRQTSGRVRCPDAPLTRWKSEEREILIALGTDWGGT